MARLFLDGIYSSESNSPSTVTIDVPTGNEDKSARYITLKGLIIGDPSFSVQNKWGPIINDISNLTDFSSAMGDSSLFSWISASTMCWKGTQPLVLGFDFILINYSRRVASINSSGLKNLIKLASLDADPNAEVGKDFKVRVHGGYAADIFSGNSSVFGNIMDIEDEDSMAMGVFFNTDAKGSLRVRFGNKMTIRNLLLVKADVTKSTVEVSDQNGGNINPLYYRVSISCTGIKPLITKEVDTMF